RGARAALVRPRGFLLILFLGRPCPAGFDSLAGRGRRSAHRGAARASRRGIRSLAPWRSTLISMGPSHLTLAALATAAAPGLEPIESHPHVGTGRGDYDSALILAADRARWIVQVP